MSSIKSMLGVEPKQVSENIYSPSKLALKLAVDKKTDYDHSVFEDKNTDRNRKILVIGTEQTLLEMQNGKNFLRGNHPVEMFVPMLHFMKAGFEMDIATPTGKPLKLEEWAFPEEDREVMAIYETFKPQILAPLSLQEVVTKLDENSPYTAVYIPDGHGAIIDLPTSLAVKKVINWSVKHDKWMISICHGPAAFLAAAIDASPEEFPYKGYKIAAFPDGADKMLPLTGYIPGTMPLYFGERLQALGVTIVNKMPNGKVYHDRKLITGDSPKAANKLGKLAATLMLSETV